MRYYFAYGSNLSVEQMAHRCPVARIVGTGRLEGYELLFRGSKTGSYLTIERLKGSYVPVVAWEISKDDKQRLDRYEGHPKFYTIEYIDVMVTPLDGGELICLPGFVYVMNRSNPLGRPSDWYYDVCREGYKRFGFDEKILEQAIYRSVINPKSYLEGFERFDVIVRRKAKK